MELTRALEKILEMQKAEGIIYDGKAYRFTKDDVDALEIMAKEIASILGDK